MPAIFITVLAVAVAVAVAVALLIIDFVLLVFLFFLSQLQYYVVLFMQLTGTVPAFLSTITSLVELELESNMVC